MAAQQSTRPPKVSVLMPAYNHGQYIDEAMASCLSQTEGDLEVIAVDDGSSDDTYGRLLAWSSADARVRVSQHAGGANLGLSATLRAASGLANGSFIAFLASDDVWAADKLERQLAAVAGGQGWCYGRSAYIDADSKPVTLGREYGLWRSALPPLESELCENQIVALTVLIRRDLFDRVGGFMPDVVLDDLHLWLRLLTVEAPVFVDAVLGSYRMTSGGLMVRITEDRADLAGYAAAVASLAQWPRLPAELHDVVHSWWRCHQAVTALAAMDWRAAVAVVKDGDGQRLAQLLALRFWQLRGLVGVGPLRMFIEALIADDGRWAAELAPVLARARARSHVKDLARFVKDRHPVQARAQGRALAVLPLHAYRGRHRRRS